MIKQRHTEGALVSIPLKNGKFGFGLLLKDPYIAFFDFFSEIESVQQYVLTSKILFATSVYNDVITKGRWLKIGKKKLTEEERIIKDTYIQDVIEPNKFRIYDPNTGVMRTALKIECIGLNQMVIYEANDIEDVLLDYYNTGKLTKWEELNKIEN